MTDEEWLAQKNSSGSFFDGVKSFINDAFSGTGEAALPVSAVTEEQAYIPQQVGAPDEKWFSAPAPPETQQNNSLPVDAVTAEDVPYTPAQQEDPDLVWLAKRQKLQEPPLVTTVANKLADVADSSPVKTGIEMLSYLQKPADAVAGGANYIIQSANKVLKDNPEAAAKLNAQTNMPDPDPEGFLHAVKSGWDNGAYYTDAMDQDWVKENPIKAGAVDFAGKVVFDPLWLASPAKAVGLISKGAGAVSGIAKTAANAARFSDESGTLSRAVNRTIDTGGEAVEGINNIGRSIADTPLYKEVTAAIEDFVGKNRIADEQRALEAARASRAVDTTMNYAEPIKALKKEYGEEAEKAFVDYVESAPRPAFVPEITPSATKEIIAASENGTLNKRIHEGVFSKEEAFNALRAEGKTIPPELLQQHQLDIQMTLQREVEEKIKELQGKTREAIKSGNKDLTNKYADELQEAIKGPQKAEIPDYRYRDQVLSGIENEPLRKAIQTLGDRFVEENKAISDALYTTGRISDASWVHFADGEHLRRSYMKWQNPEKFLKDIEKNGTVEEFHRAYDDLEAIKNASKGGGKSTKVDVKDFAQRQELSGETLQKLGLINDAQYRVMDTMNRSYKTLEVDKFLDNVANVWVKEKDEAIELSRNLPSSRKYRKVPDISAYGSLAGKYVPEDVLKRVTGVVGENTPPSEVAKAWQKMVSWWKVGKLAAPAPIMRNFYSGLPMANVFGRVPLSTMPIYMFSAGKAMKQGFKNPKYEAAVRSGGLEMKGVNQELNNIIGDGGNLIEKGAEKAMNAFGKPDQFWRLVTMMYHKDQGKTWQEAAKIADRAMFNYNDAPPAIDFLARYGLVPFAKFPYFAAKETGRAVYQNPASLNKWTRLTENEDDDQKKIRPDYLNDKQLLPVWTSTRMVDGEEQKVQDNLDLSYIIPFMNDVSIGNALTDFLQVWRTGKNNLNMQVIRPEMAPEEKLRTYLNYARDAFGPSATASYNWDKLKRGYTGEQDAKGRSYSMKGALAEVALGLKNVPINTDDVFRTKVLSMRNTANQMKSEIHRIDNSSMPQEQKDREIAQIRNNMIRLSEQGREVYAAYMRIKEKERSGGK